LQDKNALMLERPKPLLEIHGWVYLTWSFPSAVIKIMEYLFARKNVLMLERPKPLVEIHGCVYLTWSFPSVVIKIMEYLFARYKCSYA
jgi:hypothetical protein